MPLKDHRARTIIDNGKDQGYRTVTYRNAQGETMNARVIDEGSASGLKLSIRNGGSVRILDNVAKATSRTSTNAYFDRLG
jgi:hypothetical protein